VPVCTCSMRRKPSAVAAFSVHRRVIIVPSNGPKLTGADPHAEKYSVREAATGESASGAAWS
jgi:hypothetical protein